MEYSTEERQEGMNTTLVSLYVKWKAKHYTTSYQIERTDLINNIGGGLGLFTGLSVLSLLTGLKNCFQEIMLGNLNLKTKMFQDIV